MRHAELAETYAARALHFATRARIHQEGIDRCRAAGLKASVRQHKAGKQRATAAVLDAATVVIAELTLQAATERAARNSTGRAVVADPFDSSRVVVARADLAYFIPAEEA